MTDEPDNAGPLAGAPIQSDVTQNPADNDSEVTSTPPPEPNIFRKRYRQLSPQEQFHVDSIKDAAHRLLIQMVPPGTKLDGNLGSRELSVARTKLEESVMWAVKHWTG